MQKSISLTFPLGDCCCNGMSLCEERNVVVEVPPVVGIVADAITVAAGIFASVMAVDTLSCSALSVALALRETCCPRGEHIASLDQLQCEGPWYP